MDDLRQRLEFYRDLGMKELRLPGGITSFAPAAPVAAKSTPVVSATPATVVTPARSTATKPASAAAPADSPALIAPASAPTPASPAARSLAKAPSIVIPSLAPENDTLAAIQADLGDCKRCRLCNGRNKIVFGSGNESSSLVFVGEGPGADEDAQGLPFVGRAGQLLTQMIDNTASKEGIPIRRADVYICNVVKCRPPENRTPEPDEMETCGQFLFRQLQVLKPKAICALGSTAAKALLGTKDGVTRLRGNWHKWRDTPLMVTYHPSYLLRPYNQNAKREAWEDLKKVLHFVYD